MPLPTYFRACCSAVLALTITAVIAVPAPSAANSPTVASINKARTGHSLPRLRTSPMLRRSATRYAKRLMRADRLAHGRFGGGRLRATGEVLALTGGWRGGPRRIVRMWMNSSSHRAALLSRRFRMVGAGRVRGRFGPRRSTIWVVRLGR